MRFSLHNTPNRNGGGVPRRAVAGRPALAALLLTLAAACLAGIAPARAQENTTTTLYSEQVTIGTTAAMRVRGYCEDCNDGRDEDYGRLGDVDDEGEDFSTFSYEGTTYTIKALRWEDSSLFLELDKLPFSAHYLRWVLHVGDDLFPLSASAAREGEPSDREFEGAYAPSSGRTPPDGTFVGVKLTVRGSISTNRVRMDEDTEHTFAASDFATPEVDADALAGVTIVSLPASGALTLDGSAVSAGASVTRAALDDGNLKYSPPANANGQRWTPFVAQLGSKNKV